MQNKRGWTRILEATVGILIVAGVMLTTYTGPETRSVSIEDYADTVQSEILANLVLRSDLRLAILNTENDQVSDPNFEIVNDFVASQIPDGYGYLLRICELDSSSDYCKMTGDAYRATLDRDVYVEEAIVGAEVGGGPDAVYDPKKVKIYFWEGEIDPENCLPECSAGESGKACSADLRSVVTMSCYDSNGCLIWAEEQGSEEPCEDDETCNGGVCVGGEEENCDSCTEDVYSCSTYQTMLVQRCDDFNDDGCKELGSPELSQHCPEGMRCVDGLSECTTSAVAGVEFTFEDVNVVFQSGYYYYYHTRVLNDTRGVGVTFTSGQLCSQYSGCRTASVNYRVDPLYSWADQFYTSYSSEVFTLTYWGVDDNHNEIIISKQMSVSGLSYS